jgi:formamidopyrimidine-DNA glycosylase
VLHHARIHPERGAHLLEARELGRVHRAIGEILRKAIELEGSSFDAGYRTVLGLEGGFLAQNSVYGRENQPCRKCSWPITKTRIPGLIGRPTYYCERCQRKP